jgi:hypothetical protein
MRFVKILTLPSFLNFFYDYFVLLYRYFIVISYSLAVAFLTLVERKVLASTS